MEYDKLEFETTFKKGDMIPVEYTSYEKIYLQNLELKIYQIKQKV